MVRRADSCYNFSKFMKYESEISISLNQWRTRVYMYLRRQVTIYRFISYHEYRYMNMRGSRKFFRGGGPRDHSR